MRRLFVKICGVTNASDASFAAEAGADAVGFNFYPGSERFITPETASGIIDRLPHRIMRVGVFVNPKPREVARVLRVARLDVLQFSGNESPMNTSLFGLKVFKAIHVENEKSIQAMRLYTAEAFLLDAHRGGAYGGTGETFDWLIALKAREFGRVILAGGLTPGNVASAVKTVRPYGVDVSSGVETRPEKKDHTLIKEFIVRAREADAHPNW